MSTSDIERHAAASLCAALFLAVFGAIYEHFSYGVYSYYMIYTFIAPLFSGILLLFAAIRNRQLTPRTLLLQHACTAAFAVGSMTTGILKISGRSNGLLIVYPILGGILLLLTLCAYHSDNASL